jgi:hypothetical protein
MSKVIFNIATVERRRDMFLEVLKMLSRQTVPCDVINVSLGYVNMDADILAFLKKNFKSYRIKWKGSELPCEYKLFAIDSAPCDSYNLTFDDDIIYPDNYAEAAIAGIERHERKAIVGFHGIKFDKFPVTEYKAQKKMFQYFKEVAEDTEVNVIGTGCMGFYMGTLLDKRFMFDQVNTKSNCLDGSFGRWARDNKIRMIVLKHESEWMQIYPDSQNEDALWRRSWKERYKTKLSFLSQ